MSRNKTRSPGYIPGDHWCECDRCGFVYRRSEMAKEWTGLVVCKKYCWEPRHPQDLIRTPEDDSSAKGLVRPEKENSFVSVDYISNTCSTNQAVAGIAIVGCAVAGNDANTLPPRIQDSSDIPSGTFDNSL